MSDSDERNPIDDAERLYAEFAVRREEDGATLDSLCAAHPGIAEELRRIDRDWNALRGIVGKVDDAAPLSTRICDRFGTDIDPKITLEPESQDPSSAVMERLTKDGSQAGRYRMKDEVGRGGMGAVFRVWDGDLRRNLAMKLMGRGPVTSPEHGTADSDPRQLARFLEEAQITGQLDHPCIVPVHELGLDSRGRVYFTMKLVKGRTFKEVITCVHKGLDGWTQTRALGVLLKTCEAMAYAHVKGVIHRDLKPANIMVGRFGAVYVMDWGLARVMGRPESKDIRIRPLTERTVQVRTDRRDHSESSDDSPLVTMDGDVVGTPAYMSPEQAQGLLEEAGPPWDVYSAGAILYHLLAGHPPYVEQRKRVSSRTILARLIDRAPDPLSRVAPDAPPALVAICEKAMSRDPHRRYAEMQELAEDLQAWMDGRVVRAHEHGAVAELRRWIGRNKPLAASLAAAVVAALAGLGGTAYVEAKSNRVLTLARNDAENSALVAEGVVDFMVELFEASDPEISGGEELTASDLLARGAATIDSLGHGPVLAARVRLAMGKSFLGLGRYEDAETLLEQAAATLGEHAGRTDTYSLAALLALGRLYRAQARYEEAETLTQTVLEDCERELGPDDPNTLSAINGLALVYNSQGRYEDAEPLFDELLERAQQVYEADHPQKLHFLHNAALHREHSGHYEEARQLYEDVLERRGRAFGEDHPTTLRTLSNLGVVYEYLGRFEEAEQAKLRSLELRREKLGDDHPDLILSCNNLGVFYLNRRQFEPAEAYLREAVEGCRRVLGPDHPRLYVSLANLAKVYRRQNRYEDAEGLFLEALDGLRRTQAEDHPSTLSALASLAYLYKSSQRHAEAKQLFVEVLAARRDTLPEDHPALVGTLEQLAEVHGHLGEWTEAEPLARELVEKTPATHPQAAKRQRLLDRVLRHSGTVPAGEQ